MPDNDQHRDDAMTVRELAQHNGCDGVAMICHRCGMTLATRETILEQAAITLKYKTNSACRIALGDVEAWLAGYHRGCLWEERQKQESS